MAFQRISRPLERWGGPPSATCQRLAAPEASGRKMARPHCWPGPRVGHRGCGQALPEASVPCPCAGDEACHGARAVSVLLPQKLNFPFVRVVNMESTKLGCHITAFIRDCPGLSWVPATCFLGKSPAFSCLSFASARAVGDEVSWERACVSYLGICPALPRSSLKAEVCISMPSSRVL